MTKLWWVYILTQLNSLREVGRDSLYLVWLEVVDCIQRARINCSKRMIVLDQTPHQDAPDTSAGGILEPHWSCLLGPATWLQSIMTELERGHNFPQVWRFLYQGLWKVSLCWGTPCAGVQFCIYNTLNEWGKERDQRVIIFWWKIIARRRRRPFYLLAQHKRFLDENMLLWVGDYYP